MPYRRDPVEYRKLAQQWREASAGLPSGEARDAYLAIAEGYENLAEILERNPGMQRTSNP